MKTQQFIIGCAVLTLTLLIQCIVSAPSPSPNSDVYQIIDPEEIARIEAIDSEQALEEYVRSKRSGSPDFLSAIKHKVSETISSKLKKIGELSSGKGYHYDTPTSYDHKSFDWWELKKQILNTLLQAAKAIKGGVIAIKGQLIKGGGQLISAKGKIISAKGEQITNLGKHIAASAHLVPAHHKEVHHAPPPVVHHHAPVEHHAPSGHEAYPSHPSPSAGYPGPAASYGTPDPPAGNYGPPSTHYGGPSSPASSYGAPSSPSGHFSAGGFGSYVPSKYNSAFEVTGKLPDGKPTSGILIMKPISTTGLNVNMHHTGTLTLVTSDKTSSEPETTYHHDFDPRHKQPTYDLQLTPPLPEPPIIYDEKPTTSSSDNKPVIPPFKHLPLDEHIPSNILQKILGASGGRNKPSTTPNSHETSSTNDVVDSYQPPPTSHASYQPPPASHSKQPPPTNSKTKKPSKDNKPETMQHLAEETPIFTSPYIHSSAPTGPSSPEVSSNFEILPAYGGFFPETQLSPYQTQLINKIIDQSDEQFSVENSNEYYGPPPVLPLPKVKEYVDPMVYPMQNRAYQLYKAMGHIKDDSDDDSVTQTTTTRSTRPKRFQLKRKPTFKTIIYRPVRKSS